MKASDASYRLAFRDAAAIRETQERLLAVHGQADQWRLRDPEQHREVLDRFGGAALRERLTAYQDVWGRLREGVAGRQAGVEGLEAEEP